MKTFLQILLLFISLNCISQAKYQYRFKLQSIDSPAKAKEITDLLRNHYKVYPLFNDNTDSFYINTEVNSTKNELVQLLQSKGIVILDFKKAMDYLIIKED